MTREEKDEVEGYIVRWNVSVLITLGSVLATIVYGYSSLTTRFDALSVQVYELRSDLKAINENRYTSADAVRDLTRMQESVSRLENRVSEIENCKVWARCQKIVGR